MQLKGKTIFVTGGAGFIGSHFVESLAKENSVTVFDNFTSSVVTTAELKTMGVKHIIRGDIRDAKKISASMKNIDVVFHFAVACIRLSLSDERYVHDVNATGTLGALLAAKKAGVKRFIYISSSEVYGSAQDGKMSESHPIVPTTVYGASKYVGELYTKHFHDKQGLPTIIIRPFNTYGPRSHFDGVYGEVIPRFVIRALNRKQPLIFGNGNQTRDFTYVTDTVDGVIKAAGCDTLLGDTINIAYGKEMPVATLARIICATVDIPFKPVMMPPRPNDVERHAANIEKAKKILSYNPMVNASEGLNRYINWVKNTYPNTSSLLKLVPTTNW